jgi:hypothetical protein
MFVPWCHLTPVTPSTVDLVDTKFVTDEAVGSAVW